MEEKKAQKNGYKILIIFIALSIILGLNILRLYLMDSSSIIIFSLGFGLASEMSLLYMMIMALKNKDKWWISIDFNSAHEGIFELIFTIMIIVIGMIAITEYFVNI